MGAYPAGASAYGVLGMIGDVWEWTASDFHAYPGFEAFPYPEYSEVFFGPDHKVLRGGSWATRPVAIRNTFRNWDYPIRRQLFVGFRCARGACRGTAVEGIEVSKTMTHERGTIRVVVLNEAAGSSKMARNAWTGLSSVPEDLFSSWSNGASMMRSIRGSSRR